MADAHVVNPATYNGSFMLCWKPALLRGRSRQFRSDLVIVLLHRSAVDTQLPCNIALIAHAGIFPQIGGQLLLLGADVIGILRGRSAPQGCDLRVHL